MIVARVRLLLFSLAAVSAAMPVLAEVREQLTYRYYPVRLAKGESLLSALNRATPLVKAAQRFHGYAEWEVSWRYQWRSLSGGQCRIEQVDVTLDGLIQLPRLDNGDAQQKQRFDDYLAALKRHELGHYGLGQRAAREVATGIGALPRAADCRELEAAGNELGDRVVRHYQQLNALYDRDTRHGRTQGVTLDRE